jgi:hypothetical protein
MLPKIRTKTPNLMQKNEVRRVVSPSLMPTEGKLSFELQSVNGSPSLQLSTIQLSTKH